MNKARRQSLEKARSLVDEAIAIVEEMKDEEQDYYDQMPESFQGGEKGESAQTAIDELESAATFLEDAGNAIDSAIGN